MSIQKEDSNIPEKTGNSRPSAFLEINLKENPESRFSVIAEKLLNHYALCTSKARYRLVEIEFYYYNLVPSKEDDFSIDRSLYDPPKFEDYLIGGISHQDSFTHQHQGQMKNGYWYLHTVGNSFKEGKRKGLDLTIGNEYEFSYGGILIRAIQNLEDSTDYIYGPSKVVDRIINNLDKTTVTEIANIQNYPALENRNSVFLDNYEMETEKIYSCFRYGLNVKEKKSPEEVEAQKYYINKDYRYFIYPKKQHAAKEKIMANWIRDKKYPKKDILELFDRKTWKD